MDHDDNSTTEYVPSRAWTRELPALICRMMQSSDMRQSAGRRIASRSEETGRDRLFRLEVGTASWCLSTPNAGRARGGPAEDSNHYERF